MTILVIGGSGSGKSAYGEKRVVQLCDQKKEQLIYIATMEPYGEEGKRRIQRHQKMRAGKGFATIECYTHLDRVRIPAGSTVLLECMSNLTANEIFGEAGQRSGAAERILHGLWHLKEQSSNLVIIGNNVFDDGISYDETTRAYMHNLALVQKQIVYWCDELVEVVHGIPLRINLHGQNDKAGVDDETIF